MNSIPVKPVFPPNCEKTMRRYLRHAQYSTGSRMPSSLGDGLLNTNIMKNKCASGAAKLATSYHGGNQSDWFLPSSNDFVYFESSTVAVKNAAALTSTGTYLGYWASDETGTTNAKCLGKL